METLGHPDLFTNVANLWLMAGIVFIMAEVLGVTGIGLMFAGLGAVVVGSGIHLGVVAADAHVTQFIVFFVSTAAWVFLLWKPLQKMRLHKQGGEYSNIIGQIGFVGSNGLNKQAGGEVTWSGTIMKAQLVKNARVDALEAGSQVVIVDVTGATLIVKPKE